MESPFKLAVSQKGNRAEFKVARPDSVDDRPPQMQSPWLEAMSVREQEGESSRTGLSHVYFRNLMKAMNAFLGKIWTCKQTK